MRLHIDSFLPKELEAIKVKEYDLSFPKTVEEAVAQAYGLKSLVNPNVQAEGIVWWNKEHEFFEELDFRPNFKAINNKYLLNFENSFFCILLLTKQKTCCII